MIYEIQYIKLCEKANVRKAEIPDVLQTLITKFSFTHSLWLDLPAKEQKKYLQILAGTDAFIASRIYNLFKERLSQPSISISKLAALKAKAAQLKLKK